MAELEEGWLVRSLFREDLLSLPEISRRLYRHRSWVWRRLMLVEALDPIVQNRGNQLVISLGKAPAAMPTRSSA